MKLLIILTTFQACVAFNIIPSTRIVGGGKLYSTSNDDVFARKVRESVFLRRRHDFKNFVEMWILVFVICVEVFLWEKCLFSNIVVNAKNSFNML